MLKALVLAATVLSATPTAEDIYKWYPMPNHTVLLQFKGDPKVHYGMYPIEKIIPCDKVTPVPREDQIMLMTQSHKQWMRYCYMINIEEKIMDIEDPEDFYGSMERYWNDSNLD